MVVSHRKEEERLRPSALPHEPSKRKEIALYRGVLRYFPAGLALVARASAAGGKHTDKEVEYVQDRTKSFDHPDCILRHLINMEEGDGLDENGIPHVAYVAWRALAMAQEWAEKHQEAPIPPAVKKVNPITQAFLNHMTGPKSIDYRYVSTHADLIATKESDDVD